jgi:hypothetical protein
MVDEVAAAVTLFASAQLAGDFRGELRDDASNQQQFAFVTLGKSLLVRIS